MGLFVVLMVGFVWRMPQSVTGLADSDELLAQAVAGGRLHPPGYPLLWLVLRFTFFLVGSEHIALALHTLSAIFHASACVLWFVVVYRMLGTSLRISVRLFVAAGLTLVLAWLPLVTLYGQVIEVMSLTSLILMIGLSLLTTGSSRLLYLGLYGGLVLTHHQLLLPLFLLILVVNVFKRFGLQGALKPSLLVISGAGFMAFVLYEVQAWMLATTAVHSWYQAPGSLGFLKFFFREDFSDPARTWWSSYFSVLQPQALLANVHVYIKWLHDQTSWSVLFLALVGIMQMIRLRKYVLLVIVFLYSLGLGMYLTISPSDPTTSLYWQSLVLSERMWLPSLFLVMLVVAYSVPLLYRWIAQLYVPLASSVSSLILVGLVLTLMIDSLSSGLLVVDAKSLTMVSDWLAIQTEFVNTLDEPLVICGTDVTCFAWMYHRSLDPDASYELLPVTAELDPEVHRKPLLADIANQWRIGERIGHQLFVLNKPVFLTDIHPEIFAALGMDAKLFVTVPEAGGWLLGCSSDTAQTEQSFVKASKQWVYSDQLAQPIAHARHLHYFAAEYHATAATIQARLGQKPMALYYTKASLHMAPESRVNQDMQSDLDQYDGDPRYLNWQTCPEFEQIAEVSTCDLGSMSCQIEQRLWKMVRATTDTGLRRMNAAWFESVGMSGMAEYEMLRVAELERLYSQQ